MGDEHRNAGAVFAGVEDLLDFVILRIEVGELGSAEDRRFVGGEVIAENGGGVDGRGEFEEEVGIVGETADVEGRAGAGEWNVVLEMTLEIVDREMAGDIFQERDDELTAGETGEIDDAGLFRKNGGPGFGGGIVKQDFAVGCVLIGIDEEFAAGIAEWARRNRW